MGLFDFFSTGLILSTVNKFSNQIYSNKTFKYFSKDDTKMVKDYKDFQITLISSALTVILLELDLKNKKNLKDIQTVYIGKSADIIRKILSKEYSIPSFEINEQKAKNLFRGNIEAQICWEVHVKFEEILTDTKQSLLDNSALYFEKYEKPIYNEYTGEMEMGYHRLHTYIWDLFLAEEGLDYRIYDEEKICIKHKSFTELNDLETDMLNSFVSDIKKLYNLSK